MPPPKRSRQAFGGRSPKISPDPGFFIIAACGIAIIAACGIAGRGRQVIFFCGVPDSGEPDVD
jgi:hypothetical protein